MPDCFISYSTSDEEMANFIRNLLTSQNISVFMASVSLQPGQNWSKEIWSNLHGSKWVVFLASSNACKSPYVQQELGAALATEKNIIPIIWDMGPENLPGWINQKQAVDLREKTIEDVGAAIKNIGAAIATKKNNDQLVVLGLCVGILLFLGSSK